jgi:DtxR family Mn-dependent transcriptional regulator
MNPEMKLSSQMEDYLEAIYHLCQEEGVARVKTIADRLEVTNPSVVGAVRSLKQKKLVRQEPYGYIRLTQQGEEIAGAVTHRHEVLTSFLVNILGLDPQTASRDACRIEHAVSIETVKRLRAVAAFIESDPRISMDWKKGFQQFYKRFESENRS